MSEVMLRETSVAYVRNAEKEDWGGGGVVVREREAGREEGQRQAGGKGVADSKSGVSGLADWLVGYQRADFKNSP